MPLWRSPRFRCDTNQARPIVRNTNETPAKAKPTTYQTPVIVLQAGPFPRPKVAAWGAGFDHKQSRGRVQCPLPRNPGVSLAAGPGVGLRRGYVLTLVAQGTDLAESLHGRHGGAAARTVGARDGLCTGWRRRKFPNAHQRTIGQADRRRRALGSAPIGSGNLFGATWGESAPNCAPCRASRLRGDSGTLYGAQRLCPMSS